MVIMLILQFYIAGYCRIVENRIILRKRELMRIGF